MLRMKLLVLLSSKAKWDCFEVILCFGIDDCHLSTHFGVTKWVLIVFKVLKAYLKGKRYKHNKNKEKI